MVRETQDWKDFIKLGSFNDTFMTGGDFVKWVEKNEAMHKGLMQEAGFLAK